MADRRAALLDLGALLGLSDGGGVWWLRHGRKVIACEAKAR